jgi:hypothetical protein
MNASPKEEQRQCLQGFTISGREELKKTALTVTILKEDTKTLLDKEVCIEDDQAEGERQDIIACSDFEEIPNRFLPSNQSVLYPVTQTIPQVDLYSGGLSPQTSTVGSTYESMHLLLVQGCQRLGLHRAKFRTQIRLRLHERGLVTRCIFTVARGCISRSRWPRFWRIRHR